MPGPLRVGVLASGEGTNLQSLLDTVHGGEAQIVAVAGDKPAAVALERARSADVPTAAFALADHPDRDARDAAILEVVTTARPSVGRTRTVEILRGGRSQALVKSGHDGLPAYGTFDHLTAKQVLARVDELIAGGRLRSTGGMYPKLERT